MSFKRVLLVTASIGCFLPVLALAQTPAPSAPAAPAVAAPAAPAVAAVPAAVAPAAPVAAAPVVAAPAPAAAGNANAPVTHGEFSALLKEALMKDPQLILDAVKSMHEKQMADTKKEMQEALAKRKDDIANDKVSPRMGAADADVTVVEFFDYHCGYCKRMTPTIQQLLDQDKKVRVIFREFPILSEDSMTASRAALAVNKLAPEKYWEFHQALMKVSGKYDEKALAEAAKKVGVDAKKMTKEMNEQWVTDQLDANRKLAEDLGIRGTPALIVGDEILPGAVPYEDLKKVIDSARAGKPAAAVPAPTQATAPAANPPVR